MPRISLATYCERRAKLRQSWQVNRSVFRDLSPQEQWLLHDYYRFVGLLTQSQLQQHRSAMHDKRPSLPQRAGRAYAAFEQALAASSPPARLVQKKRKQRMKPKVKSLVRPEPHMKKLAKVLLGVAGSMLRG